MFPYVNYRIGSLEICYPSSVDNDNVNYRKGRLESITQCAFSIFQVNCCIGILKNTHAGSLEKNERVEKIWVAINYYIGNLEDQKLKLKIPCT